MVRKRGTRLASVTLATFDLAAMCGGASRASPAAAVSTYSRGPPYPRDVRPSHDKIVTPLAVYLANTL